MGQNNLDVSTTRGNTQLGPIWFSPTPLDWTELDAITFTFLDTPPVGWVRLGHISTDGVDSSQESTVTPKLVWTANLGNIISEASDKLVVRLASATDTDVLGFIFGDANVTETVGMIKVKVNAGRSSATGTILICGQTDDLRDFWVLGNVQVDPNVSRTFVDTDLTVYEVTLTFIQPEGAVDATTHLELIEPVAP